MVKLTLRKPKISDVESFREVFNDKEVVKQLVGFKYPLTTDLAKEKLKETINKNKKGDYYEFAVIANGKWVGMIVLEKPSKDKKTFTLGYAIGRKYWNKGITTEAIKLICDFGFNKLKLDKVIADNDEDNPASGRVLEKNGFRFVKKEKKRNTNVLFWERKKPISIEIIKNKKLTKQEKILMNKIRIREGGEEIKKEFDKDYPKGTIFFFVKENNKVMSFGGLQPIKMTYHNKNYNILGICNIFSVEKGKGYGSILIKEIINSLKKEGKTGIGFTGATKFFKKAGLKTEKDFIRRFVYVKPDGEKVYDNEGDGIYYEGKDKFVSKVLKTKSPVYINVLHW